MRSIVDDHTDMTEPGTNLQPEDVPPLLRERRYADVIGCPESARLDFKEGWYRLGEDREKWELAKDVAAMANSSGGFVIRGVATVKRSTAEEETASEVKPIPAAEVDLERHRSIVQEWTYPLVRGVDFSWYPSGDEGESADRGLLVIEVPPQDSDQGPFLITKAVDDGERVIPVFSLPMRDGAHTDWEPPGVVWRDISDGHRSRRAGPGPASATPEVPGPIVTVDPATIETLTDEVERFMGWGNGATVLIASHPTEADKIPADFYSPDGLFGALSKPPTIRWAGFALSHEESPERLGTDLVVSSASERCLWLRPDGLFAAAMNADGEFLSWSYPTDPSEGSVPINAIVLVEFALLYAKFVHDNIKARYDSPTKYWIEIRGSRSRSIGLTLPSGYPRQFSFHDQPPTGDSMLQPIEEAGTAESDAYQVVAAVYDFFGVNRSLIPFTTDGRIDTAALVEQSRR